MGCCKWLIVMVDGLECCTDGEWPVGLNESANAGFKLIWTMDRDLRYQRLYPSGGGFGSP